MSMAFASAPSTDFFRTSEYSDTAILQPLKDAKKTIWSVREGEVEPWTSEGFSTCMTAALQSGAEWRELRRRSMDGKEAMRLEKKHVCGPNTLPRGVGYDKATGVFSYVEPGCSRVVRMCALLLAGDSFHTIAAKVGGGVSHQGVRSTLRNSIWAFGTRVYPANEHREEAYEVRVIDQPLISVATWKLVQAELDRRKGEWRKTKQPARFLLTGLLKCSCKKPWYIRVGGPARASTYYCSTRFAGRGPVCGAPRVQQKAADAVVAKMVSECFTDPVVMNVMLNNVATPTMPVADRSRDVTRLEARRERILEQRADGLITREKCNQQIAVIDRELQAARATVAIQAPVVDVKRLAAGFVRVFGRFHKKPFEFQRDLLREAVREIVIEAGAVCRFTFRGGFLGGILEGANLSPRHSA